MYKTVNFELQRHFIVTICITDKYLTWSYLFVNIYTTGVSLIPISDLCMTKYTCIPALSF